MDKRHTIIKIDKIYIRDKKGGKKVWRHRIYLKCGHTDIRMPSTRVGNNLGALVICKKCI